MISLIKKSLFMVVLVAGLSVASMAQKGGQDPKKPPPKPSPPVVTPREKPPRGDEKPKKPGGFEAQVVFKEDRSDVA